MHRQRPVRARVLEGDARGQQLVEDHRERVDVGHRGGDAALRLLRRGVAGERRRHRVEERPLPRVEEVAIDARVEHADRRAVDEPAAARAQEAVDAAGLVVAAERLAQAQEEAAGLRPRHRARAPEERREVLAGHVRHEPEDEALRGHADVGDVNEGREGAGGSGAQLEGVADPRLQGRDEARLRRQLRAEDLEGDRVARADVLRAKDRSRRALADLVDDPIAAREELADRVRGRQPGAEGLGRRLAELSSEMHHRP
ncbi:MAG: hypothetical protein R3A79_20450 [Nannocystaceae bacterium]